MFFIPSKVNRKTSIPPGNLKTLSWSMSHQGLFGCAPGEEAYSKWLLFVFKGILNVICSSQRINGFELLPLLNNWILVVVL